MSQWFSLYSKTCVKWPLSKRPKIGFQAQLSLHAVKHLAECSKGSILQYFQPSLSYHLSLRSLFCLFLSSRFTQVLLYLFSSSGHKGWFCSQCSPTFQFLSHIWFILYSLKTYYSVFFIFLLFFKKRKLFFILESHYYLINLFLFIIL